MIRRPPRSTRPDHSFPTRRSSDLCISGRVGADHAGCGRDAAFLGDDRYRRGFRLGRAVRAHRLSPRLGPRTRRMPGLRSEEHTSELQSLMRISYAVFCLKKKKNKQIMNTKNTYMTLL